MLLSFLITFFLVSIISIYAFTGLKFSTAFGILNLMLITFAVGFRQFGYDYYSYKTIYEAIAMGDGYITEWITQFIIQTSESMGIGFRGFLTFYAIMNFTLVYVVARMERISITVFLSVYCILLFSLGPLVTIRSSLSSLIFCIALYLYFRRSLLKAFLALLIAIAFHGAALLAASIALLVAVGRKVLKGSRTILFLYFTLLSLIIHSISRLKNITEYVSIFTNNDTLLRLAGRVEAYQGYVWLNFTSIVHYFQVASIVAAIIGYRLLNPTPVVTREQDYPSHKQDAFATDVVNFSIIFCAVSFLYFNLVWGTRIMEFFAPLLAVLIVKYGQNRKYVLLLLLLCLINLVNVFLGYMSSYNWQF